MTIDMRIFPEDHVWVPAPDGRFYKRSVQPEDKERRSLVTRLLSRPWTPRGKPLSHDQEMELWEERKEIRKELEQLPKPWELED